MAPPLLYRCCPPSPTLAPYIALHWSLQGDLPPGVARKEYLHPEGGCGLLFNQGDPILLNGRRHPARRWLNGPSSRSAVLCLQGRVHLAGVRFLPGVGRLLLQAPLHELLDHCLDSDDFPLPSAADKLLLVLPYHDLAQQKYRIEQGLSLLLAQATSTDIQTARHVQAELQQLRQHTDAAVRNHSSATRAHARHMQRLFRDHVGVTPQLYVSQRRVQLARERIQRLAPAETLTTVAHDLHFHDQAHFIRAFQRITGQTPGQYRQRQHDKRRL